MEDKWAKIDFEFTMRHVGIAVEFYARPPEAPQIAPAAADRYERAKDTAPVFIQNRDGVAFGADELLGWSLRKRGAEIKDLVPLQKVVEAFEAGRTSFMVQSEIDFTPDSFSMDTTVGRRDLKRLGLLVEFTVRPKPQA